MSAGGCEHGWKPTTCPHGCNEWAPVETNEHGEIKCPMGLCDATLYLVLTYCVPLGARDSGTFGPADAVTDRWQVECVNGHVIHDGIDQIRQMNADDPEACLDETGDMMPTYDHRLTHAVVARLSHKGAL